MALWRSSVRSRSAPPVEIEIQAKEILFLKKTLNSLLAEHTGQPLEKINEDTERDYFLSPSEAVEYGLIDKVIKK